MPARLWICGSPATKPQLTTIFHYWFFLLFPHPSIPSELSGHRINYSCSMSVFLFGDILSIIRHNHLPKVWTDLFASCRSAPSCQFQHPTTSINCQETMWRDWNRMQTRFVCVYSGDWNSCMATAPLLEDCRTLAILLWSLSRFVSRTSKEVEGI